MAYLRRCYSAPCRAFADEQGRTHRIHWYWAPEGAEEYEELNTFQPRIDDLDTPAETLYEFTAKRTNERRYTSGRNRWGTTGLHVHGDEQDFLGESLSTKYRMGGRDPQFPCAGIRTHFADIFIGAKLLYADGRRPIIPIGLKIGAKAIEPVAAELSKAGLKVGGVAFEPVMKLTVGAGLRVGGVAFDPAAIPPFGAGLRVGAVAFEPAAELVVGAGLRLGGLSVAEATTVGAGLRLGGISVAEVTTVGAGLCLGAVAIVPA